MRTGPPAGIQISKPMASVWEMHVGATQALNEQVEAAKWEQIDSHLEGMKDTRVNQPVIGRVSHLRAEVRVHGVCSPHTFPGQETPQPPVHWLMCQAPAGFLVSMTRVNV